MAVAKLLGCLLVVLAGTGICEAASVRVLVPGRASGLFGEPPSGAETDLVPAVRMRAGQAVVITAEGSVDLGLSLIAPPDGLDVSRHIIEGPFPQGYTPLEESGVDQGMAYADLPPTIEHVGALIGTVVADEILARADFMPRDQDRWSGTGIDPADLFLIGRGPFRLTPAFDGMLFLGINEPFTGQNVGEFVVTVTNPVPLPPAVYGAAALLLALVVNRLIDDRIHRRPKNAATNPMTLISTTPTTSWASARRQSRTSQAMPVTP
jgi:hypothetical protein